MALTSLASEFKLRLTPPERAFLLSLEAIDEARFDNELSHIKTNGQSVTLAAYAADGDACPFTLVLGRGEHDGRISFYIGAGVEIIDWEHVADPEAVVWMARDLDDFFRSKVRCDRAFVDQKPVDERYWVARYADRSTRPLRYRHEFVWPWTRRVVETRNYQPWVESPSMDEARC